MTNSLLFISSHIQMLMKVFTKRIFLTKNDNVCLYHVWNGAQPLSWSQSCRVQLQILFAHMCWFIVACFCARWVALMCRQSLSIKLNLRWTFWKWAVIWSTPPIWSYRINLGLPITCKWYLTQLWCLYVADTLYIIW